MSTSHMICGFRVVIDSRLDDILDKAHLLDILERETKKNGMPMMIGETIRRENKYPKFSVTVITYDYRKNDPESHVAQFTYDLRRRRWFDAEGMWVLGYEKDFAESGIDITDLASGEKELIVL